MLKNELTKERGQLFDEQNMHILALAVCHLNFSLTRNSHSYRWKPWLKLFGCQSVIRYSSFFQLLGRKTKGITLLKTRFFIRIIKVKSISNLTQYFQLKCRRGFARNCSFSSRRLAQGSGLIQVRMAGKKLRRCPQNVSFNMAASTT